MLPYLSEKTLKLDFKTMITKYNNNKKRRFKEMAKYFEQVLKRKNIINKDGTISVYRAFVITGKKYYLPYYLVEYYLTRVYSNKFYDED